MQVETKPGQPVTDRRRVLKAAIYGLWSVIAGALAAPAAVYLLFPPRVRKDDEWVTAGDISRLAQNTPVEMVFRKTRTDGWKVISEKSTAWVVKLEDSRLVAFGPQCTHLGCAYHWEAGKREFLCPCHTSVFSIDGTVVSGPAPRPLDKFETKVENNKLLLGRLKESPEAPA